MRDWKYIKDKKDKYYINLHCRDIEHSVSGILLEIRDMYDYKHESLFLNDLECLDLDDDVLFELITEHSILSGLKLLDLSDNIITDKSIKHISDQHDALNLEELIVVNCLVTKLALTIIANSENLNNLKSLEIEISPLCSKDIQIISEGRYLKQLKRLHFFNAELKQSDIMMLFSRMSSLETIEYLEGSQHTKKSRIEILTCI